MDFGNSEICDKNCDNNCDNNCYYCSNPTCNAFLGGGYED